MSRLGQGDTAGVPLFINNFEGAGDTGASEGGLGFRVGSQSWSRWDPAEIWKERSKVVEPKSHVNSA